MPTILDKIDPSQMPLPDDKDDPFLQKPLNYPKE